MDIYGHLLPNKQEEAVHLMVALIAKMVFCSTLIAQEIKIWNQKKSKLDFLLEVFF